MFACKLWLMAACLMAFPGAPAARAQSLLPYQDPSVPAERRIDDLLSRMTTAEKVDALSTNAGVPRLGVPGTGNTEGLHGIAQGGPSNWGRRNPKPTTQFPQAVGLGETWDPDLIRRIGAVEGQEARYLFQNPRHKQGGLVVWGPNADLARDIRWGRTEESFGEDPFLAGSLVVAEVKGLQGDGKYWLAASLMKHFLANSNEPERAYSSSNMDERQFEEYYSVPFRMGVIQGGARAYMASYNAVNGVPMMVSPILRRTIERWGQNGIITSDGGALGLLIAAHKAYPDTAWGAAASIKAGINQFLDNYRPSLQKALADGLVSEGDIDRVLRGRYRVLIRLGQLDPLGDVAYRKIGAGADDPNPSSSAEHRALARLAAQKSIVLLKNQGGLLPLERGQLKNVAVIGPWADSVLLDWYSGTPPYKVSPLQGIRDRLGSGVNVTWSTGADTAAAVAAAKAADVAIVIAGNHPECNDDWEKCPLLSEGKEAVDRRSIQLEQESLIKHIARVNQRTVVVLISSFPYAIVWTQENVPAILHMAQNGQELGNALADALFGDVNPGGRLVHTWVRSLDDLPPRLDYDLRRGRTYMYFGGEPLYPFGYGLSYTTFTYTNLRVSAPQLGATAPVRVQVDVRNTGKRAGDEVVQLYVQHLGATVYRPLKELRGFQRITLEPGEVRTVSFALTARDLAYWDADTQQWRTEAEPIRIQVGASSKDIRLEGTVRVTAGTYR